MVPFLSISSCYLECSIGALLCPLLKMTHNSNYRQFYSSLYLILFFSQMEVDTVLSDFESSDFGEMVRL